MRILYKILSFFFPDYFQQGPVIENNINYKRKSLLSECEKEFYKKLKKIENVANVVCLPQINLASIIEKNYRYRNELFRNIDFGIFDKEYNPLLLIELNDSTHNQKRRKIRDNKIKNICEKANLKLITFYTKYPNKEEYIMQRILEIIKED